MSALIIDFDNRDDLDDINNVLKNVNGWEIHYVDDFSDRLANLELKIKNYEIDFLICTRIFSGNISQGLNNLRNRYPLLTIIYYNAVLKENDFAELYRAGIKYCFIGDCRQDHLKSTLLRLRDDHWRRVPEHVYETPYHKLPARAKRILKFIETNPIRKCSVNCLADHLRISPSHMRKEFKRLFGINFREFKNRLFTNYEDVLLFEKSLKPGDIFKTLNYTNLSAFSRSFRARHGDSWQALVRQKN